MCWMPLIAYRGLLVYNRYEPIDGVVRAAMHHLDYISEFFYYSSSLINPIIYSMMSRKFREALKVRKNVT